MARYKKHSHPISEKSYVVSNVCAEEFFDFARNGDILTGRVTITGKEQFGEFLTANVSDSNNTGKLSYLWTRSSDVGDITTGDTYFVDKRFM